MLDRSVSQPKQPVHTPYDGDHRPFTIGLKPLDLDEWIEVDGEFSDYLAEKTRLYQAHRDLVFREEPGTASAQREVLELLADHLPCRFPEHYRLDKNAIEILSTGAVIPLGDNPQSPLWRAAQLVQEDLVLMRRTEAGWRLVAASVCFPSSWKLAEKFGHTLDDIHDPVPGFGPGSRSMSLMTRIFDNLKVDQPVIRYNWSLNRSMDLFHPQPERRDAHDPAEAVLSGVIRVERQTLRRLPDAGDILFTIRIHRDPMTALRAHPDAAALAKGMAEQISAMSPDELGYKHMRTNQAAVVTALKRLAAEFG